MFLNNGIDFFSFEGFQDIHLTMLTTLNTDSFMTSCISLYGLTEIGLTFFNFVFDVQL